MFDFGIVYVAKPTMQPAWIRIDWRDGKSTFHNLGPAFGNGKHNDTEWCARPFRVAGPALALNPNGGGA